MIVILSKNGKNVILLVYKYEKKTKNDFQLDDYQKYTKYTFPNYNYQSIIFFARGWR